MTKLVNGFEAEAIGLPVLWIMRASCTRSFARGRAFHTWRICCRSGCAGDGGDGRADSVTEDMVIAALLHDIVEDKGGLPRLKDVEGLNLARTWRGWWLDFLTRLQRITIGRKVGKNAKKAYIDRLEHEDEDVAAHLDCR